MQCFLCAGMEGVGGHCRLIPEVSVWVKILSEAAEIAFAPGDLVGDS